MAVGCSSKDNGAGTDDPSDPGGNKRDGGAKTDAKAGTKTDGSVKKPDSSTGGIPPGEESAYERDDTGNSGLSAGDIDKLRAGGADCAAGSILYPYDKTVFPIGLAPPQFMFAAKNDGSYVKFTYDDPANNVNYETANGASSPGKLDIDPEAWTEVLRRTKGKPLNVDVSVKNGGSVSTCHYKWTIAQGSLTGTVFYNTYNHPDLGGQGAVLRLPLGSAESDIYLKYDGAEGPSILAGPCLSCHSVSFNGEKMAASTHSYNPGTQFVKAATFPVTPTPDPKPTATLHESTFAAFTPDGGKLLAMGNPQCTAGANAFPRAPNNFMLVPGPAVATLHDANTGKEIAASGLNKDWYMWMPQFSPDGRRVVFNHAKPDGNGGTDRRQLAIMDYDDATNTFSNLQVIVQGQGPAPTIDYAPLPTLSFPGISGDCKGQPATPSDVAAIPRGTCSGPCYPGWPFFTPDGSGVIYVLGSEPDFAAAFPGRDGASKSELWYVDLTKDDHKAVKLGNAGDGLPTRPDDAIQNYYPTVLPVSVGGYFWLFWTSMRDWGTNDLSTSIGQAAANWFGGASVLNAARKRIWVSAIRAPRVGEGYVEDVVDFSSKPFYLEGQANAGNIRAFAALNPCLDDGNDCTTGIDCCSGYCNVPVGKTVGTCVPPKTCADRGDKCETSANCCPQTSGASLICLAGFCDIGLQ